MTTFDIFCADLGSTHGGNFGWFGRMSDDDSKYGTDISELAESVAGRLNLGHRVALGFEAPMFVPLRDNPMELTRQRVGERGTNWIGGPGASVLATGLAQVPWILRAMRSLLSVPLTATQDWNIFSRGDSSLILWEAFVSGGAKGDSHVDDARIAVDCFKRALPNPPLANAIQEPIVTSLIGAAMLRTGWSTDLAELSRSCMVFRA